MMMKNKNKKLMSLRVVLCFLLGALGALCALPTLAALAQARGDGAAAWFFARQAGDATYYNYVGSGGHCSIRAGSLGAPAAEAACNWTIALNSAQYDVGTSEACGMCVEIVGNGTGAGADPVDGRFLAFVNNECPTCFFGDVDIGIPGGDGRWDVKWLAVECPVSGEPFRYFIEGGVNLWYVKFQVQNHLIPVRFVAINGSPLVRTTDNHWGAGAGFAFPLTFPLSVSVESVFGEVVSENLTQAQWNAAAAGGTVGTVQFTSGKTYVPQERATREVSRASSLARLFV